jgi:hypothetical protein
LLTNQCYLLIYLEAHVDISKAKCPECGEPLTVERMVCKSCKLSVEGAFELPPLAELSLDNQLFVAAFVRHHGSIKKMESLFGVSYPTIKNRLNAISAELDKNLEAPSPNIHVLEQLSRGEITVEEALEKLG